MAASATDVRPVCYMVMPFRKKKVDEPRPTGAPAEIDFDALWERAYWPAITDLGYLPLRADFDPSSAIVKAMLERITFADLVIADVSLGNGNVYYEVGIRHVARQAQCVLVAPDWSKPLFDIAQFASIRFPLVDGSIPQEEAQNIHTILTNKIPLVKDSLNPYHELVPAPQEEAGRKNSFREYAERLSAIQAMTKAVRLEVTPEARQARLAALLANLPSSALEISEVALDLIYLIRDVQGWQALRDFIGTLPTATRKLPLVDEQLSLATAETGDPIGAIASLEQLIASQGDSPERRGIIGGRYKRLWWDARKAREKQAANALSVDELKYLGLAIENYSKGMTLDLNEFYCSSNLPPLLQARHEEGDEAHARFIDQLVVTSCQRALDLGTANEWVRPTLLGAAFRTGDTKQAQALTKQVLKEGPAAWKLKSTLADLQEVVRQASPDSKPLLQALLDQLTAIA